MNYSRLLAGMILIAGALYSVHTTLPPHSTPLNISGYTYNVQPAFSGWDDVRLQRLDTESDRAFSGRLIRVIFESIYHCDYLNTPRLIDRLAAKISGSDFNEVGNLNLSTLKCGYCHQLAYILAKALNNGGVKAEVLGMEGHVVTLLELEGKQWIADADMGSDLFEYNNNVWQSAKPFYQNAALDRETLSLYEKAYKAVDKYTPYYSMEWLESVEVSEKRSLGFVAAVVWNIAGYGLYLIFTRKRVK